MPNFQDKVRIRPTSEEARPQVGASSKEKALKGYRSQTPAGHSSPATGRGILAFSRKQKVSSNKSIHRMDLSVSHQIKTWRYWYMQAFSMSQSKSTVQGSPSHSIAAVNYFLNDFRASKESLSAHRIRPC